MTIVEEVMSAVINKRRLGKNPTSVTLSWRLFNEFKREVYTSTILYHGWNFHAPTKKPQFQGLTIGVAKKFSFKGFRINCKRPPKWRVVICDPKALCRVTLI